MSRLIDGKAVAAELRARVAEAVAVLADRDISPGLATVLVGEDPASRVYVRNKIRMCAEVGIRSIEHAPDAGISQAALLDLVGRLNADPEVDGILVQLPLPAGIDASRITEAIDPLKDVDGFHTTNAGRLSAGLEAMVPCTPAGCMILLRSVCPDPKGLRAVVVGRSNIVGKPVAQLLLAAHCTVTIAHSRTVDLDARCREADILIAAVGRAEMIRGGWIGPGATVIDVGINRIEGKDGKGVLVGDVEFEAAKEVAGAITPVPGGVGPMTIACLLRNTVIAACRRRGMDVPEAIPPA
ncbi:MAG: bifunctional methylenetetrahydrofolate dehydrogenase/methenyltetrahydrofolate cyclohydrolase FolD [Defluviicoccus sp.]|nr:bifunctional methylenetetrahydrofolate dehydrogenase/methenyltetrahydrofolate cyclohydrolase FolD [Defluviicoccus sp.]